MKMGSVEGPVLIWAEGWESVLWSAERGAAAQSPLFLQLRVTLGRK